MTQWRRWVVLSSLHVSFVPSVPTGVPLLCWFRPGRPSSAPGNRGHLSTLTCGHQATVGVTVLRGQPWEPPGGQAKCLGVSCGGGRGCPPGRALIPPAALGEDSGVLRGVQPAPWAPTSWRPETPSGAFRVQPPPSPVTRCPSVLFAALGFRCFSPLPVASEGAQVTAVSLLQVTMSIRPSGAQSRGDLGWAFMVDMGVRDVMKQHARGPCVPMGLRTMQRLVFL